MEELRQCLLGSGKGENKVNWGSENWKVCKPLLEYIGEFHHQKPVVACCFDNVRTFDRFAVIMRDPDAVQFQKVNRFCRMVYYKKVRAASSKYHKFMGLVRDCLKKERFRRERTVEDSQGWSSWLAHDEVQYIPLKYLINPSIRDIVDSDMMFLHRGDFSIFRDYESYYNIVIGEQNHSCDADVDTFVSGMRQSFVKSDEVLDDEDNEFAEVERGMKFYRFVPRNCEHFSNPKLPPCDMTSCVSERSTDFCCCLFDD
jgi:hypothetical protein